MNPAEDLGALGEAALTYATQWGWAVIPLWWPADQGCACGKDACKSVGKHPLSNLVPSGLTQASRDPDTIRMWWGRYPQANVGIRTGEGLTVLDIDPRHGGNTDFLEYREGETIRVATGGGGEHLYYRSDIPIRNSAGVLAPGVDVRGEGGYVVAVPSLHVSGDHYQWSDEGTDDIAPLPVRLTEQCAQRRVSAEHQVNTTRYVEGGRNDALTSLGGSMRRRGLTEAAIRSALREQNRAACRPPLAESEVDQIARSVAQYPTEDAPAVSADIWEWGTAHDVLRSHLDPPVWLCEQLELGPGRPFGLWGYGGTGKTYIAQRLALSVASGQPFLNLPVTKGRVRHVSWEMGRRAVRERYRALERGMGAHITEGLEVSTHPSIYLNSEGAEEIFLKEFDGYDLVILDSLRRACPGEDENSSAISNFLDVLTRVSERTGATFLLLHHSGKSSSERSSKETGGRGSSAIFDGSGAVWLVEGEGAGPRSMSQLRAHDDGDGGRDSIALTVQYREDLVGEGYTGHKIPLDVVEVSPEDLHKLRTEERLQRGKENYSRQLAELWHILQATPGATSGKLQEITQMRRTNLNDMLLQLESEGKATTMPGRRNTKRWIAMGDTPPLDDLTNGLSAEAREAFDMGDFADGI